MVNLQGFVSRRNFRDRKSKIVLFYFLIDFDVLHRARCWPSAALAMPAMAGLLYIDVIFVMQTKKQRTAHICEWYLAQTIGKSKRQG